MSYIEVCNGKFKMDKLLVQTLDDCKKRIDSKWDIAMSIDGDEGSGKSNLAIGVAYYLSHKLGKSFSHNNIFFDINELIKFAATARKEVIVFDEAALGAMGNDFQNKMQKKLIKMLITSRKYGNVFIFVIPQFFRLNRYIANDRTIGLLHTFSRDGIRRGDFLWLGKKRKNACYDLCKRKGIKSYKPYTYVGSFPKGYEDLIDVVEYDKKKDKAIMSITVDDKDDVDSNLNKLNEMKNLIANCPFATQKDMAAYFGVTDRTLRRWKNQNFKTSETGNADEHSKKPLGGEPI